MMENKLFTNILKINTPIRKILLAILAMVMVLLTIGVPFLEKKSCQAVIRNTDNELIQDQVFRSLSAANIGSVYIDNWGETFSWGDHANEGHVAEVYVDNKVKTYSVGDYIHGGIVFWVDECGQQGLVCAIEDQSAGVSWFSSYYSQKNDHEDGTFSGKMNTANIIAAHLAIGDDGNTYAAHICNELEITKGGITYGDWYLPSKEELNLMYLNKATIDDTAAASDVGGSAFVSGCYWSSNIFDNHRAWYQYFFDGSQDYGYMDVPNRVRAIRKFRQSSSK